MNTTVRAGKRSQVLLLDMSWRWREKNRYAGQKLSKGRDTKTFVLMVVPLRGHFADLGELKINS